MTNMQKAPWPAELASLVAQLTYRAGWRFELADIDRGQGSVGLTFIVTTLTADSYVHDLNKRVAHYFPVPPAAYDARSWQRWLLDRLLEVERHECCEFFEIAGTKTYAPSHGPGNDPYLIRELGTELDVRTSFRGEVSNG